MLNFRKVSCWKSLSIYFSQKAPGPMLLFVHLELTWIHDKLNWTNSQIAKVWPIGGGLFTNGKRSLLYPSISSIPHTYSRYIPFFCFHLHKFMDLMEARSSRSHDAMPTPLRTKIACAGALPRHPASLGLKCLMVRFSGVVATQMSFRTGECLSGFFINQLMGI